jgi:hypothetical protein
MVFGAAMRGCQEKNFKQARHAGARRIEQVVR